MTLKYFEIIETDYRSRLWMGYFYPCDATVTPQLLRELYHFVSGTESFDIMLEDSVCDTVKLLDRERVDLLISMNEYIGYDRFSLKKFVLTGPILKKFLKYGEESTDPEEVNDKWRFGNVSFEVEDMEEEDEKEEDEEEEQASQEESNKN